MTREAPAPEGVRFYGGPLSNFTPSPITLQHPFDGLYVQYRTVEHRFPAMKAHDAWNHDRVRNASSPQAAKHEGRRVPLRDDWEAVKYHVMVEALRAKFEIPQFRARLLATGRAYIFEHSPTDATWGLWNPRARNWTGLNLLGEALMQVRAELRHAGHVAAAVRAG